DLFTGTFRVPGYYKKEKRYHLYSNRFNWRQLQNELKTESDTPRFVYTHMMLPHEPFYLDSTGKEVSDTSIILQTLNERASYLNQVVYVNRLIKDLLALIPKSTKRDLVIILEGDHAFKYEVHEPHYKFFRNLNALYFSDGDYSRLYNGISPVNTFRVILNKYFCQALPLLKDSSIYLPPLAN
ncbi:MAG: sulfatase-like hydrolase/transferase, partial [Flavisolibacter sp.]|nr:sulfatase-like hydrolase/transferase [Flavisolibacter sp.]